MFESLKNKTAVVTGASSGIGEACVRLLADNGVTVYAVARRGDRLEKLAQSCAGAVPVVQDVTKDLAVLKKAIAGVDVDILVNNAGGALGRDPVQDAPVEKWQGMIDVNVKGVIAVTQLVLPRMIERGQGDIVNVSSIAGLQPYPGGSVYCGVKAAVRFMSEAWQQDLIGKGIRIMCINPGLVETEFSIVRFDGDKEAADKVYAGMNPLTAEDVAENIVWMVSRPSHVNVQAMTLMPTDQATAGMVFRRS